MFFVAIPLLHLLFVLAQSEQPSRTWNLPRIDPASSPPKIRDEDKSALAAEVIPAGAELSPRAAGIGRRCGADAGTQD